MSVAQPALAGLLNDAPRRANKVLSRFQGGMALKLVLLVTIVPLGFVLWRMFEFGVIFYLRRGERKLLQQSIIFDGLIKKLESAAGSAIGPRIDVDLDLDDSLDEAIARERNAIAGLDKILAALKEMDSFVDRVKGAVVNTRAGLIELHNTTVELKWAIGEYEADRSPVNERGLESADDIDQFLNSL